MRIEVSVQGQRCYALDPAVCAPARGPTEGIVLQIKSKRVAIAVAVSGACLAAVTLAPTASSAATGYTVSKGGAVTATNSASLVFVDQTSQFKPKLTCPKASGSGTKEKGFHASGSASKGSHKFVPKTYKSASGLSAAGSLTKVSLVGCSNPQTGVAKITQKSTWSLGFSSKTSSGAKGYLYNVSATVSASGCSFTSTGAVYGTYSNSTGVFTGSTTAGLTLSKVTGGTCSLLDIANKDKAYLSGQVKIAPKLTVK